MSAMVGHDMRAPSDSHQPHASTEERLTEQAREIQQLREQLAKESVKEGLTLPPVSCFGPCAAGLLPGEGP